MRLKDITKKLTNYVADGRASPDIKETIIKTIELLESIKLNESEKTIFSEALKMELKRCSRYSKDFKDKRYKDTSISLADKMQVLIDDEL